MSGDVEVVAHLVRRVDRAAGHPGRAFVDGFHLAFALPSYDRATQLPPPFGAAWGGAFSDELMRVAVDHFLLTDDVPPARMLGLLSCDAGVLSGGVLSDNAFFTVSLDRSYLFGLQPGCGERLAALLMRFGELLVDAFPTPLLLEADILALLGSTDD